ncbi:Uncharacterized protein dnm_046460 [Desulfonema magnum]|uniref:Uncharacterized protein n=1 Tax=Desulfonema magnum TaxID=45655 RepID=A0A975BP54_9BACT|nr:Uncharacterized protein dnm_046460 [Desulfonema magnum]
MISVTSRLLQTYEIRIPDFLKAFLITVQRNIVKKKDTTLFFCKMKKNTFITYRILNT